MPESPVANITHSAAELSRKAAQSDSHVVEH